MSQSFTIGIAGGTGSGKTTFVRRITETFSHDELVVISQDSFYKDMSHLPADERGMKNFDHPDSFDSELMVEQVNQLKSGQAVQMPIYDYRTHTRSAETMLVKPHPVMVVEGILCYVDPRLEELMDLKIFMDVPGDIRLIRRIHRDMRERGRTLQSVTDQYLATVLPMDLQYVQPLKDRADIIITGGGKNEAALDVIVSTIRRHIQTATSE